MIRKVVTVVLAATLVLMVASAVPASAKAGAVTRHGSCSAHSSWTLKLSPEDNGIQAEFEVDSNRSAQSWNVKLFPAGHKVFQGKRTTGGAKDSFTLRKVTSDGSGTDAFRARAVNAATGEVCVGRASI